MHCYPHQDTPPETPIPAPSPRRSRKCRYADLMALVTDANGDWVVVTDDRTITGKTPQARSTAIHSAAFARHIKVRTTHQHGFLYIALLVPGATEAIA
jgi:hypothetical protein